MYPFGVSSWLTISLCIITLIILITATQSAAEPNTSPPAPSSSDMNYFVLIDAGSTGSRAHVHKWRLTGSIPTVEISENKKIKPGLSSYEKNPTNVRECLADLLSFIQSVVPSSHWSSTPIHVHATAGLRSIPPEAAEQVLRETREFFATTPFMTHPTWIRIISGEQEGINGWVAVNYLNGLFSGETAQSTGIVEMGGSSMQITFEPADSQQLKGLSSVSVGGRSYTLYSHSFLQYGLQAAEKLYQRLAIDDIEEEGNPCYPKLFRHSSVGDFTGCTKLLEKVVDTNAECLHPSKQCSFNGVFQPKISSERFLAIENFFYTAKFFGTAGDGDHTGQDGDGAQLVSSLRDRGQQFCNSPFNTLKTQYADTPVNELATFCFSAAYQSIILEQGLGFTTSTNLQVAKTIKGKSIDWELGAVVLELSKGAPALPAIEAPPPSSRRALPPNTACTICYVWMAAVATAGAAAFIAYSRYAKRAAGTAINSFSNSAFGRV